MILIFFLAAILTEGVERILPPLYTKLFQKDPDTEAPTGWILIICGVLFLLPGAFVNEEPASLERHLPLWNSVLVWTSFFSVGLGIYRLVEKRRKKAVKD